MPLLDVYIAKVFKSIKSNARNVAGEQDKLDRLFDSIRTFYVSLFTSDRGIFKRSGMDKKLTKPPKKPATAEKKTTASPAKNTTSLGKGRPGVPRKEQVSKRQERRREQLNEKRKATSTITTATSPATPKKIAPRTPPPVTSSQPRPMDPVVPFDSSFNSSSAFNWQPTTPPRPPAERQPTETRRELDAQISRTSSKEKRVSLMQSLGDASRDEPPNQRELELFWDEMDGWGKLDARAVAALLEVWNDITKILDDPCHESFLQQLVHLQAISNGVKNCTEHFTGAMVRHAYRNSDDESVQVTLETMCVDLQRLRHSEYTEILQNCECQSCAAVLEFDARYKRYHTDVDQGAEMDYDEPPMYKDRPMHCRSLELRAQSLRAKYSGLSLSSLQRAYYFANSTPPLSPPAISTATPTDVQTVTIKYMLPYLKERRLLDPLPTSWQFHEPAVQFENLIEVHKDRIHFYDGDSAEVHLSDDDKPELLALATHGSTIRIRMKHHDAPESEFAVRIYKQTECSSTMQKFVTRHIGIESLRAIRAIVFQAQRVYVEIVGTVRTDFYKRRLMNIFVETLKGELQNTSELLARQGYSMSFYTTGMNTKINNNMREAINNHRGIFTLPEDVFTYPYRPWDLRKLWPDVSVVEPPYTEFREILNPPADPGRAWRAAAEPICQLDNADDDADADADRCSTESQQGDRFYFRVVPSTKVNESKCFKAQSTIPNAGYGLFLRPHDVIAKGAHLCLYSAESTTEVEMDSACSSRDYALQTGKRKLWFDAEREDGNNLARFANQAGVVQSLQNVKELSQKSTRAEFFEADWKELEDKAADKCNAAYKVSAGKLILCTTKDLQRTQMPEEIFTCYGGLRTYWLSAIAASPSAYPHAMSEIVQWLLTSPECNWTAEQRRQWTTL